MSLGSMHLKVMIKGINGFCCKCTLPLKRHERTSNGEPNLGNNCNVMSKTDGEFIFGIANFYILGVVRNLPIAKEAQQEIEQTCGGRLPTQRTYPCYCNWLLQLHETKREFLRITFLVATIMQRLYQGKSVFEKLV